MPTRNDIDTLIATNLADHSRIEAPELRQVHDAMADYIDQQDSLKVDAEAGKTLVSAAEKATWNAKQPAGDYATNADLLTGLALKADEIDSSFEVLTFASSLSVPYNAARPNKKITLTGNIAITNTNTDGSSAGIYLLTQDATGGRTVTINGTAVNVNPTANSRTLIGWSYNGTSYDFDSNANQFTDAEATVLRQIIQSFTT